MVIVDVVEPSDIDVVVLPMYLTAFVKPRSASVTLNVLLADPLNTTS